MKNLNISPVDAFFVNDSYTIEFLLYYKNKVDTQKIKSALKKLSADFWPIFGQYESGKIHFDKYVEKDCFEEEIRNEDFDSGLSYREFYDKFGNAVPAAIIKLFYLKIIQYNNGSVLIPKMKHLAGDGYSYFYFLSVLAQISQSKYLPFKNWVVRLLAKPNNQRTKLKEFNLPDLKFEKYEKAKDVTVEDESIAKSDIRKLIREIDEATSRKVSTNDVLSAMVIKKLVSLQNDKVNKDYLLTMPVDVRRIVKEYGSKFFGNGLMFHETKFNRNDILKLDISKLALQIRQGMPELSTEFYKNYLHNLENIISEYKTDLLKPYDPETGCLVTNLTRLPAKRLNFGSGNPDLIFPLTIGKNAVSILSDEKNFILRLVY